MRNLDGIFDYRPTMVGTLSTIGGTAVGASVDRQSFAECLAILTAGAVAGSGTGALHNLDIKIQENSVPTGTGWTDITDEAVSQGSATFSQLSISGTDPQLYMDTKYIRLADASRERYIRAHATLSGTVGLGAKFSVGFLLGKPSDTLYITGATTQATGGEEYTKLL